MQRVGAAPDKDIDILVFGDRDIFGIPPMFYISIPSDFRNDTSRTDDLEQTIGFGAYGELDRWESGR